MGTLRTTAKPLLFCSTAYEGAPPLLDAVLTPPTRPTRRLDFWNDDNATNSTQLYSSTHYTVLTGYVVHAATAVRHVKACSRQRREG